MESLVNDNKKVHQSLAKSTEKLLDCFNDSTINKIRSKTDVMKDLTTAHTLLDKATASLKKKRKKIDKEKVTTDKVEVKKRLRNELKSVNIYKKNVRELEQELEAFDESKIDADEDSLDSNFSNESDS